MTHQTYLYSIFCLASVFNKAARHKQPREQGVLTYSTWHPWEGLKKKKKNQLQEIIEGRMIEPTAQIHEGPFGVL